MNITLRQLTYFKALAEQRNFGRAADDTDFPQNNPEKDNVMTHAMVEQDWCLKGNP